MKFLSYFLFLVLVSLASAAEESQGDEMAAESSVAKASGARGYGYPYRIAPTLTPLISSRSDDDEDKEAPVAQPKSFSSKLGLSTDPLKKGAPKKYKSPFSTRRLDSDEDSSLERRFRSYKEPKYRNFAELESRFRPRRMDLPYPEYDYSPKSYRRPSVSPRDPYLSPEDAPSDGFYPTVPKVKSYSSSYGQRLRDIPSYGAGRYEDPLPYHDDEPHYTKSGYESPSKYPPSSPHYDYQEDYAIESNKPITGDIRKRLLDYAGASDLYEGEPDYLQEVSRNKNKYGHVANDYYAYGGPGYRNSYREFPYVESKISILKKTRV